MHWFPITLLCAFSLASADAATKAWLRDYSAWELALVRFAVTGLLLAPLALFTPLAEVAPAFWLWVVPLVPLEIIAMLLYMQAIRDYPFSATLPYLAFTPVLVVITGWLILDETVAPRGLAGILLVVAGSWLLNLQHARRDAWRTWFAPLGAVLREPGSQRMLGVAGIYSLTSTMGKGAVAYTTPETFGALYFALVGAATALIAQGRHPGILRAIWRRPWAVLVVSGLTGVMVVTHFLALSRVEVAYMISVKRTSLLFGILYGALLFRELGLGRHLFAGALMVSGVALILL
jgi:drug/metabolite transporter (DMT)-like permease